MLLQVNSELRRDAVVARDGPAGSVDDVYFDDERWAVRYLVVDTGGRLPGRRVLIKPESVARAGVQDRKLRLELTREQVYGAPGVESELPSARRLDLALAQYSGHPYDTAGLAQWRVRPAAMARAARGGRVEAARKLERAAVEARASHLRSGNEVTGYSLLAIDGALGRVVDLEVDERDWRIGDFIVDTHYFFPARRVAVPHEAVAEIDWRRRCLCLHLTQDQVRHAPRAPSRGLSPQPGQAP